MQSMTLESVEKTLNYAVYPTHWDAAGHIRHTVPIMVWSYAVLLGNGLPPFEASRKHEISRYAFCKSFPFFLQSKYISCVTYTTNSPLYYLVSVSASRSMPWTGTYYDRELLHEIIKLLSDLQNVITPSFFFLFTSTVSLSFAATFINIYRTKYAYWSETYRDSESLVEFSALSHQWFPAWCGLRDLCLWSRQLDCSVYSVCTVLD